MLDLMSHQGFQEIGFENMIKNSYYLNFIFNPN